MRKKLNKIKSLSLDELRVRGSQVLNAYAERSGVSNQARVPTDAAFFKLLDGSQLNREIASPEDLLHHFRTRTSPNFFATFSEREQTVEELRRRFGRRTEDSAVERARKICEGRFDLLGLRDLDFGDPIDWHLEPVSGRRAPAKHWSRINYLDAAAAGDKKIIWELNRHQYFMTLGRAYWYTNDERYAATFATHLEEWMNSNTPKQGINWASSLEVSFRAISWLWALYFFKDSRHLSPELFARALKYLYLHARHLETYLSTYFSPNTHLTGEALGLFYLGTIWPEFRRAARWREEGLYILLSSLDRHVRPDGVYFEQSSYYHRYTTDFYTHLYVLAKANGEGDESRVVKSLTALLDHLMYITRPDGTTPLFGDDDGGRLVMLDERAANDFRSALSTGACLFARGDYKAVAGELAEETVWLLGVEGTKAFDELDASPPEHSSLAFKEGGYYVMRDDWTRDANYMLMDCGPHGTLNCGHAHADALSFDLAARGRTLLVDPGTYTYTGSTEMRDYFRSSAAHNTLTIDDESSSVPGGPFTWETIAHASLRAWTSRERFDFFEGEHDGYARLASPATHVRSVFFLKKDYWVIRDRVLTTGAHRYRLYFHSTPDAQPEISSKAQITVGTGLELFTFADGGEWRVEEGWVSESYAARQRAPVSLFSRTAEGAQDFLTFLLPCAQAEPTRADVREISANGGRVFEVVTTGAIDMLLIGKRGHLVETAKCAADGAWAWMRTHVEGAELTEWIVLDGRRLMFGGREIFTSDKRAGYVFARRCGDELLVDTDARGEFTLSSLGARLLGINGKMYDVKEELTLKIKDGVPVSDGERVKSEMFV